MPRLMSLVSVEGICFALGIDTALAGCRSTELAEATYFIRFLTWSLTAQSVCIVLHLK